MNFAMDAPSHFNAQQPFTSLRPGTASHVAPLVGSVGSRDSQQFLQIQQYAQQFAQVYAEQYTTQYARLLAEQQQRMSTPQTAAVPPAFQPLPAVSEISHFTPHRVYTHTPTGPKLESLNLHTPKIAPISPLAQVAAQVANRPQGTTFHFALSG
jgi:hypothetical protein